METASPGKSTAREIIERAVEAGLSSVPVMGNALAVAFVTALGWRLEERHEQWFTELAETVEQLRGQVDGLSLEALAASDLFTDAVVTATFGGGERVSPRMAEARSGGPRASPLEDRPRPDAPPNRHRRRRRAHRLHRRPRHGDGRPGREGPARPSRPVTSGRGGPGRLVRRCR